MQRWKVYILALLALLPVRAFPEVATRRLVVVPFARLGVMDLGASVMVPLELALARQGYAIVAGDIVEDALEEQRIRYLDSISPGSIARFLTSIGADAVLVGGYSAEKPYRESEGLGMEARLLDATGKVLWAGTASLSLADTRGWFGAGERQSMEELIPLVSEQLLSTFPDPDRRAKALVWGGGGGGHPRAVGVPEVMKSVTRIAVLPLLNLSTDTSATRLVESIFLTRFGEREPIQMVEPADLRAALAAERFTSFRRIGPPEMKRIGERVGTKYFLTGTIVKSEWEDDPKSRHLTPAVRVSLHLVDTSNGRVVWSGAYERTGASFEGLLRLGSIRTNFGLVDRVAAGLVDALYDN